MANLRNQFFSRDGIEQVFSEPDKTPSILLAMIPGAVKYRLSKMPSLGRSISSYTLRARPTLQGKRPQSFDLGAFELGSERTDLASSVSTTMIARPSCERGADAGWKYANQGRLIIS